MARDMRGELHKNLNPREGKQDPQYKGSIIINGERYWLSAWLDTVNPEWASDTKPAGSKYFSLAAKKADPPRQRDEREPRQDYGDSDIPFSWAVALPLVGLITGAMSKRRQWKFTSHQLAGGPVMRWFHNLLNKWPFSVTVIEGHEPVYTMEDVKTAWNVGYMSALNGRPADIAWGQHLETLEKGDE